MSRITFLAVTLALALASPAAHAAPCVLFAGLQHCPVNGAGLAVSGGQLVVTASQPGGVSIATPGATGWTAQSRIELAHGVGDRFQATALVNASIASIAFAADISNGFLLSAGFTSATGGLTLTAQVYRDGVLQGSAGGLSTSAPAAMIAVNHPASGPEELGWPAASVTAAGSYTWTYRTIGGVDRAIALPDGHTYVGDELRLVQDATAGHAGATFDHVVLEGNLHTTRLLAESVL